MKEIRALHLLGQVDEEYIIEAAPTGDAIAIPRFHKMRRLSVALIAALLALLLMGAGVVAVIYGEDIQSMFFHRWQLLTGQPMNEEQTVLMNHWSQNIGQSQTVNGVTVTLDSATVGENAFYLLVRVEEPELTGSRNCSFEHFSLEFSPDTLTAAKRVGGYSWSTAGIDQDGNPLLMIDQHYTAKNGYENDTSPLDVTLTLTDLSSVGSDELLCSGTWEFQFSLDRSQIPEPIRLPDTKAMVTDYFSEETAYGTFTNIELSNTGIRYNVKYEDGRYASFIHVLRLKNGLEVTGFGGSGVLTTDMETMSFSIQWNVPVDLEDVMSVQIGDVEIFLP